MSSRVAWFTVAFIAACGAGAILYAAWFWKPVGLRTWFGAMALVNIAIICLVVGLVRRPRGPRDDGAG